MLIHRRGMLLLNGVHLRLRHARLDLRRLRLSGLRFFLVLLLLLVFLRLLVRLLRHRGASQYERTAYQ